MMVRSCDRGLFKGFWVTAAVCLHSVLIQTVGLHLMAHTEQIFFNTKKTTMYAHVKNAQVLHFLIMSCILVAITHFYNLRHFRLNSQAKATVHLKRTKMSHILNPNQKKIIEMVKDIHLVHVYK